MLSEGLLKASAGGEEGSHRPHAARREGDHPLQATARRSHVRAFDDTPGRPIPMFDQRSPNAARREVLPNRPHIG